MLRETQCEYEKCDLIISKMRKTAFVPNAWYSGMRWVWMIMTSIMRQYDSAFGVGRHRWRGEIMIPVVWRAI